MGRVNSTGSDSRACSADAGNGREVATERYVLRLLPTIADTPLTHLNVAQSLHGTRGVRVPGVPGPYRHIIERIRKELREE